MREPFQNLAATALARWIRSRLPDVAVHDSWPEADDPLWGPDDFDRAITVQKVGAREDEKLDLRHVDMVPLDATTGLYTWQVRYCTQGLQLDVWAKYKQARHELLAQLDDVLNAGELYTLGYGDPVSDGLRLKFDPEQDFADGYIAYMFDGPATNNDIPERVRKGEWRATMACDADFILTVRAESPRLLYPRLKLIMDPVPGIALIDQAITFPVVP